MVDLVNFKQINLKYTPSLSALIEVCFEQQRGRNDQIIEVNSLSVYHLVFEQEPEQGGGNSTASHQARRIAHAQGGWNNVEQSQEYGEAVTAVEERQGALKQREEQLQKQSGQLVERPQECGIYGCQNVEYARPQECGIWWNIWMPGCLQTIRRIASEIERVTCGATLRMQQM